MSSYTQQTQVPFDTVNFDTVGFGTATSYAVNKDYVVINTFNGPITDEMIIDYVN